MLGLMLWFAHALGRSRPARWAARALVLAGLLALTGPGHAEPPRPQPEGPAEGASDEPDALQAALYLGPTYEFGAGQRTVLDSFQYLALGAVVEHEWIHFDVETPAVFLLPDAAVALIGFLAGSDIGLPLFSLLNGEGDPGRMQLISGEVRANPWSAGPHRLSAGLQLGFSMVGAVVDGERLGRSLADVGATVAYRYGTPRCSLELSARGGNGFGNIMDGNPYVGARVLGQAWISNDVGLLAHADARAQWLDLSDPDEHYLMPNDLAELVALGAWTLGVAFRID